MYPFYTVKSLFDQMKGRVILDMAKYKQCKAKGFSRYNF